MKLVVTADSLLNAKSLADFGVDILLVGHKDFTSKMNSYLTIEEVKELKAYVQDTHTKLFFNANLICHDEHIARYTVLFQTLKDIDIDGIYVSDVSLIKLAEMFGLKDRVIYNPETLITNSFDANYYLKQGIRAITLSKEITLEDYQAIASKVQGGIDIVGFGHYSMFHTKRSILKTYADFRGVDKDFTFDNNVRIKEELRNDLYPVLEEETSTTIYRSYATNVYESLNELSFVDYLRIDGVFKDVELIKAVVEAYKNKLNNPNIEFDFNQYLLEKFNETTDTGFLFKKTVYGK